MKMPFGKYKGIELEDIIEEDMGYFIWLTGIDLKSQLKDEVTRLEREYEADLREYEDYFDYITMDRDWQWKIS